MKYDTSTPFYIKTRYFASVLRLRLPPPPGYEMPRGPPFSSRMNGRKLYILPPFYPCVPSPPLEHASPPFSRCWNERKGENYIFRLRFIPAFAVDAPTVSVDHCCDTRNDGPTISSCSDGQMVDNYIYRLRFIAASTRHRLNMKYDASPAFPSPLNTRKVENYIFRLRFIPASWLMCQRCCLAAT